MLSAPPAAWSCRALQEEDEGAGLCTAEPCRGAGGLCGPLKLPRSCLSSPSSPSASPPSPPRCSNSLVGRRGSGSVSPGRLLCRQPRFLCRWKNKGTLAGSQVAPGGPALPPASPRGSQHRLLSCQPPAALREHGRAPRLPPSPRWSCRWVAGAGFPPLHPIWMEGCAGTCLLPDPSQQQQVISWAWEWFSDLFLYIFFLLSLSPFGLFAPSRQLPDSPAWAGSRNRKPPVCAWYPRATVPCFCWMLPASLRAEKGI